MGIRLKTKQKKPILTEKSNCISYSGKNAKKILDWIYKNSNEKLRLDRKYERYLEYFKNY